MVLMIMRLIAAEDIFFEGQQRAFDDGYEEAINMGDLNGKRTKAVEVIRNDSD